VWYVYLNNFKSKISRFLANIFYLFIRITELFIISLCILEKNSTIWSKKVDLKTYICIETYHVDMSARIRHKKCTYVHSAYSSSENRKALTNLQYCISMFPWWSFFITVNTYKLVYEIFTRTSVHWHALYILTCLWSMNRRNSIAHPHPLLLAQTSILSKVDFAISSYHQSSRIFLNTISWSFIECYHNFISQYIFI
jgi:hypothetical protein